MVIFDVGANIGKYSAELCRNFSESKIIAFEPDPNSYQELIKLKASFQNIEAFNIGVSKVSGRQILYAPEVGSPLSSFDNKNPNFKKIEINVISLADFCKVHNCIPNVIKIDVEGHEFQVLQGAEKILEHLKLIQFEFGPTNIHSRIFLRDIWDYLTPKGFQLNIMTKSGLLEVSGYKEIYESFRTTNYLAIRN
jgi:FkbM family methyltransferase